MTAEATRFDEWAVVELLGHRKLAGRVREETLFGTALLRLDVPTGADGPDGFVTQFYGGGSIYCITPTDEAMARAFAARNQPEPVHRYELPPASAEEAESRHIEAEVYADDEDEEPF